MICVGSNMTDIFGRKVGCSSLLEAKMGGTCRLIHLFSMGYRRRPDKITRAEAVGFCTFPFSMWEQETSQRTPGKRKIDQNPLVGGLPIVIHTHVDLKSMHLPGHRYTFGFKMLLR